MASQWATVVTVTHRAQILPLGEQRQWGRNRVIVPGFRLVFVWFRIFRVRAACRPELGFSRLAGRCLIFIYNRLPAPQGRSSNISYGYMSHSWIVASFMFDTVLCGGYRFQIAYLLSHALWMWSLGWSRAWNRAGQSNHETFYTRRIAFTRWACRFVTLSSTDNRHNNLFWQFCRYQLCRNRNNCSWYGMKNV